MLRKPTNDYIYDIEIRLKNSNEWVNYIPNCPRDEAQRNVMCMVLAGNPNIAGVRVVKYLPEYRFIEQKTYLDSNYSLAE